MTNTQVFYGLAGIQVALIAFALGFMKYYIDAKVDAVKAAIDPIRPYIDARINPLDAKIDVLSRDVKTLIDYMISHEGRISRLEERTK